MEKIKDFLSRFWFPMIMLVVGLVIFVLYNTGVASYASTLIFESGIIGMCVVYVVLELKNPYEIIGNLLGGCLALVFCTVASLLVVIVWNPFSELKRYELLPISKDVYYSSSDCDVYYFEYTESGHSYTNCLFYIDNNGEKDKFSLSEYEIAEDANIETPCVEMKAYKDLSGVYKAKILVPLKTE